MKVSQIMVEPVTIDKDQRLSYAMELLDRKRVDRLIVTENDEVRGILTYADIADRLGVSKVVAVSIGRLHVSSAMSDTVITVTPDDEVDEVANLMVERGMSGCPVVDDEKGLVGVVTKRELLPLMTKFKDIGVKELMTSDNILMANPVERLIKARSDLLTSGFSGMPVVDGQRVLGLLTEKMIATAMAKFSVEVPDKHRANQIRQLRVVDAMLQQPPLISADSTIADAAQIMLDTAVNTVPVVEEGNRLVGIISTTDIAKFVANKFRLPNTQ
ncbi:MAG: CBS domain-containing protein [Candidatus Thorarchaeota archaeon]